MKLKFLILCTGNSCRSILFEALMNHYASDKYDTYSAGSSPTGQVNPNTLKTLEKHSISTANLRSKSWDEFNDIKFDLIITVCDSAANESCPVFLGNSLKIHLSFNDPAHFTGSDIEIEKEFNRCFEDIKGLVLKIASIDISNKSIAQVSQEITNFYNS